MIYISDINNILDQSQSGSCQIRQQDQRNHYSWHYLFLCGDVIINEGNPLVWSLTTHTCDPCHWHLTGFDGGFCPITAKLCFFLWTSNTKPSKSTLSLWTEAKEYPKRNQVILYPENNKRTWFRVTNSASKPTKSLGWGISFNMSGINVAWHFRCFLARDASASKTLASIGFFTKGEKNNIYKTVIASRPVYVREISPSSSQELKGTTTKWASLNLTNWLSWSFILTIKQQIVQTVYNTIAGLIGWYTVNTKNSKTL